MFEPGMVVCVESYTGRVGGKEGVKLEEQGGHHRNRLRPDLRTEAGRTTGLIPLRRMCCRRLRFAAAHYAMIGALAPGGAAVITVAWR